MNVVELRQYTLKAGGRDVLIDLFDRYFVEGQEQTGMTVLGQFRDLQRPERFVWLRSFPNMEERHRSLEQFYGGPVWAEHREAANATMLEFDDVLLLRPARPGSGIAVDPNERPEPGAAAVPCGLVLAGIHLLRQPAADDVLQLFDHEVFRVLRAEGVDLIGSYVTEQAKNTFQLPVREGENAVVWIGRAPDGRPGIGAEILTGQAWQRDVTAALGRFQAAPSTLLELAPTGRSLLR
jgi:NIPSNAP